MSTHVGASGTYSVDLIKVGEAATRAALPAIYDWFKTPATEPVVVRAKKSKEPLAPATLPATS